MKVSRMFFCLEVTSEKLTGRNTVTKVLDPVSQLPFIDSTASQSRQKASHAVPWMEAKHCPGTVYVYILMMCVVW